jgi:predicted DNA-binding transcriptional regulator AlpA
MLDPLLTSEDLVKSQIAPSVRTLDGWATRGVGPKYLKVGRHRRYREADVQAWLASRERNRQGDAAYCCGSTTCDQRNGWAT